MLDPTGRVELAVLDPAPARVHPMPRPTPGVHCVRVTALPGIPRPVENLWKAAEKLWKTHLPPRPPSDLLLYALPNPGRTTTTSHYLPELGLDSL